MAAQVVVAGVVPDEHCAPILGDPVGYYEEDAVWAERCLAEQAFGYLTGHQRAMLDLECDPAGVEHQVETLVWRSRCRPRMNSHLRKGVNQESLSIHGL